MIRRPPRSTLFPYTRSSDLAVARSPAPTRPVHGARRAVRAAGGPGSGALRLSRSGGRAGGGTGRLSDRKSTRLNSSHGYISYAVFCLKKKKNKIHETLKSYT